MAFTMEEFTATSESAFGTAVPKYEYPFKAKQYPTWADAVAAGDIYTDDELLTKRNADLKNSASAVARDAYLIAQGHVKPTTDNSPYLRLVGFYKLSRKSGRTHEEAVQMAVMNAGEDWPTIPVDGSIKWKGKGVK